MPLSTVVRNLICLATLLGGVLLAAEYRAPAGERAAIPRPGAETVLPGGRLLRPHGRQYATGPGPFGLVVSDDGKLIVTANGGPHEYSLSILEQFQEGRYMIRHLAAPKENSDEGKKNDWRGVFMGVAFADKDEVYISEGNSGRVRLLDLKKGRSSQIIELDSDGAQHSYSGDLAIDYNRNLLYVVDQANFRLCVIDLKKKRLVSSIRVGYIPFALTLSPDARRAYVTNVGMFQYKWLPGIEPWNVRDTAIPFPAFGFPSTEASNGTRRKSARGNVEIPALGDPNASESNSLAVVNLDDPLKPRIEKRIRTGKPFGEESMGGSSPSGVLAVNGRIYVANSHNDSITVIDAKSLEIIGEILIEIPGLETFRGVIPSGMDYHPSTGWLLVAEAGVNAVAVIDTKTNKVIGHIPAAWYPNQVKIHGDTVYVAAAKGHGTGPNANRMIGFHDKFQGHIHRGAVTVFPIPAQRDLLNLTSEVMAASGFVPLQEPVAVNYPADVRHVVLIVKESRSFDEVLGDVQEASNGPVDSAPMLARFGRYGSAEDVGGGFQGRFRLRGVNVTPNLHALAERYALSDNFYSDAETSVGGHHWLIGAYLNPWSVSSLMASYGGQKDFRIPTLAPGRLLFSESSASVHPEEIPEAGTLWRHLERNGVSFRNFGEGFELAGVNQGAQLEPTGARFLTNVPMPDPLFRNTSRTYPQYNVNIPDQYRATQFINEIEEMYREPGRGLPQFLYIHLPNDDMSAARPADGYPYTASYVADNDYALGRIVAYLSGTPWWKNMVIFVTEDDASGGVDHVDSHRTVLLAIGPHVRKNYVSRRNVSFPGLHKTIFGILRMPPLNLFDVAANDLSDCFGDTPDFAPYEAIPIRKELFNAETARPARR